MKYLVETALLGHGLYSIKDSQILSIWPANTSLAWVEKGSVKIGDIEEFIHARSEHQEWGRFDGLAVESNAFMVENAFLTASGTMAVAKRLNCPIVVTAGIGGIGDIKTEPISYDLPALAKMGITLVATAPKDMLDYQRTFEWLAQNNVKTYGYQTKNCNGYIFKLPPYALDYEIGPADLTNMKSGYNLVLNPIPEEKRVADLSLLAHCVACGVKAEARGEFYHPTVNACFDKQSEGMSSLIQLEALVANVKLASQMIVRD